MAATINLSNLRNLRGDSLLSAPRRLDGDHKLDQLRALADEFVGLFFYGTLLKGARESRLTDSKIGFGGRGEQAFGAQLDMELAQRMGRATNNGLTESIVRQLSKRQSEPLPATAARTDVATLPTVGRELARSRAAAGYSQPLVPKRRLDVVR